MDNQIKYIGLYVHIPFCLHKCAYCDFCSSVASDKVQMQAYVDALALDIINSGKAVEGDNVIVDSVYFGGGTPSLLAKKDIEYLTDTFGLDGVRICTEGNKPEAYEGTLIIGSEDLRR